MLAHSGPAAAAFSLPGAPVASTRSSGVRTLDGCAGHWGALLGSPQTRPSLPAPSALRGTSHEQCHHSQFGGVGDLCRFKTEGKTGRGVSSRLGPQCSVPASAGPVSALPRPRPRPPSPPAAAACSGPLSSAHLAGTPANRLVFGFVLGQPLQPPSQLPHLWSSGPTWW